MADMAGLLGGTGGGTPLPKLTDGTAVSTLGELAFELLDVLITLLLVLLRTLVLLTGDEEERLMSLDVSPVEEGASLLESDWLLAVAPLPSTPDRCCLGIMVADPAPG